MSVQSVNYIINTFGLGSFSIEQLENLYLNHSGPCETKDEITGNQKLINTLISMAEQKGGETISFAVRLVKVITCSMNLSQLEGNVIRILEFAKAVTLYCPNYESKNTGLMLMKYVYENMKLLTNQFVREMLPKFKEFVYFHLELIKKDIYSSILPSILSSLCSLLFSLRTVVKPIINNIEPVIFPLFDSLTPEVRKQATMVITALTRADNTEEAWKKTLSHTLMSITYALAEMEGTIDPSLDSIPRLPLPPMGSFGRISPSLAFSRLSTLLLLLQSLLRYPPAIVSFPAVKIVKVLGSVMEAYVPPGRRMEEASATGTSLSPREQWMVLPLVYPFACHTLSLLLRRLQQTVLVVAQPITRLLTGFVLRCYRDYDISITIAAFDVLKQFVLAAGPSILPLLTELLPVTIQLLHVLNTARDNVSISQGGAEGGVSKRQSGKKNRRKQPVLQLGQPGDGGSQSNGIEHFVWESHPNVMKLFVAVVNFTAIVLQNSRFLSQSTRLELELAIYTSLSHLLYPSPLHREKLPVVTNKELRQALLQAASIACSIPLPSGQLSPLTTLMPTIHQAVLSCDQQPQLCLQQRMAMNMLNMVHHAPAQMVYRAMENEVIVTVNEIVEKTESAPPSSPTGGRENQGNKVHAEAIIPSADPWTINLSSSSHVFGSQSEKNPFINAIPQLKQQQQQQHDDDDGEKISPRQSVKRVDTNSSSSSPLSIESIPILTGKPATNSTPSTHQPHDDEEEETARKNDMNQASTAEEEESERKKRKIDEDIHLLRKMSLEYSEKERKRSIDLEAEQKAQESDEFAFSEDGEDDFDVPDIQI